MADDYIEIQQLYANYARALDLGQGERFAATFVEEGEFTGGRPAGRAGETRTP
jgi:SnoaL-like protein